MNGNCRVDKKMRSPLVGARVLLNQIPYPDYSPSEQVKRTRVFQAKGIFKATCCNYLITCRTLLKLSLLKKNILILGTLWGLSVGLLELIMALSAVPGKFSDLAVVSAANSVDVP